MLDIAKRFDTKDHDLLLKKLSLYGIKNIEFEWFKSYLHQRQQALLLCDDRASCKTACGWWVNLYKYVLIKIKLNKIK